MAIGPVTTFDTFTKIATDTWGATDNGQTWQGDDEEHWSCNYAGVLGVDPVAFPAYDTAYIDLSAEGLPDQASSEILTRLDWSGTETNPNTDFGPVLRRSASNTFYMARILDSQGAVSISVYVNGTIYELGRVSADLQKTTQYWVRFRLTTSMYLKIWKVGVAEPAAWTLTTPLYTGSNGPSNGDWGFGARRTASFYTVRVYNFYAYTLEETANNSTPVFDSFDREVYTGWGINGNGQPWEGNFSVNPEILVDSLKGTVTSGADGYANYTITNDHEHTGIIGPSLTGDREIYAEVAFDSATGSTWLHLMLRSAWTLLNGAVQYTGYAARLTQGATNFTLVKKTLFGGAWTTLTPTTTNNFTALVATTKYSVRFQIVGTTIQARLWIQGTAEPGTWNLVATDSSITSGQMAVNISAPPATANTRQVKIYQISHQAATVGTTNYTTTGNLTTTSVGDTSIAFSQAFTNDSNANNSLTVEYKLGTVNAWTTFAGTVTRGAGAFTFTITGLKQGTFYNIRTTVNDVDTVLGNNPRTLNVTTTNTGVTPLQINVTGVGTTSINVEATYLGDSNTNSSATFDYRAVGSTQTPITDSFTAPTGTALNTHTADVGTLWVKHPQSDAAELKFNSGRIYSTGIVGHALSTKEVFYYQNYQPPQADITISADIVVMGLAGYVKLYGRMNTFTTRDGYFAFFDGSTGTVGIARTVAGTTTLSASGTFNFQIDSAHKVVFNCFDTLKQLIIDGVEVCRSTNNSITGTGYVGVSISTIGGGYPSGDPLNDLVGTPFNHLLVDNFSVTYRAVSGGGSYTSAGAGTADRPNKKFTKSITGLTIDTIYEIKATFSDADGIYDTSVIYVVSQTIGQGVSLSAIGASPNPTSAVITVIYLYDSNNDSTLSIQYRPIMEYLWTTVSSTAVLVNRGSKTFSTTITSLKPSTTYEVMVTVADPNGIINGGVNTLSGLFTTKGVDVESQKQTKHYLWKVYGHSNEYITTWHDAGDPEFAWHQNGGVSDLTVTLPRKLSDISLPESGIDHQYRIDVWAIDPSSDGFGPNLTLDPEFELGAWTLSANALILANGPDGSKCLRISTASNTREQSRSDPIFLFRQVGVNTKFNTTSGPSGDPYPVPYVIKAIAKARSSKMRMYAEAYDKNDNKIDTSNDIAETVGADWQNLKIEYTPPKKASYIKVVFENDAKGTMWADKVQVKPKELLIYRGRIESYTPTIDQNGESVDVEVLGLVSLLSDDYISFLQFVTTPPAKDTAAGRPNIGPTDPSDMLKEIINVAKQQNPKFALYYTTDSIRSTGTIMEYTFRDQQVRAAFDKVRNLCPPGWHYYVEPDGLVVLRGPQHATTHTLRLGVEIMNFSVERNIRNLKNFVVVKGRQDEDGSEPDGYGSIRYTAFDQESIDKYGKRMLFIRDANITDPNTAEIIGDGRLEEYNREEQRAQCNIPDDKSISYVGGALRGYDNEAFRPGDNITILDPVAGPRNTYWDQLIWDQDSWNTSNVFAVLPDTVPVTTVQLGGSQTRLELSERQPSSVSDFGRLYRWLQLQDAEKGEES